MVSHDSKYLSTTTSSDEGEVAASSKSTVVLLELCELPDGASRKSNNFCSESQTLSMESCESKEEEGSLTIELEREVGGELEPFSEISCGTGD